MEEAVGHSDIIFYRKMGCGCKTNGIAKLGKPTPYRMSSGSIYDQVLSYVNCMECAVSSVITGALCYYFVPGAASTSTAVQIAGVSFVSQIAGKYVTKNYMSS